MKVLHLNLTREWFLMILHGKKPEEYRELSVHYISLLFDWRKSGISRQEMLNALMEGDDQFLCYLKKFDKICFSNGYKKNRPQFLIDFKGLEIRTGKQLWGAKKGKKYFVLNLAPLTITHNYL